MPLKNRYTTKDADDILAQFEKALKRWRKQKGNNIKRAAAEKDLLKWAEQGRDMINEAVGGDKAHLTELFGGDCHRFHQFDRILKEVEFAEGSAEAKDERWAQLKQKMDNCKDVLTTLGMFKPLMVISAPTSLAYNDIPETLEPGVVYNFPPVLEGATIEMVTFTIGNKIAPGFTLDPLSGVVSGSCPEGTELREANYFIQASNSLGRVTATMTFSVRAPPPESITYTIPKTCVGVDVKMTPVVVGGLPGTWTVEPPLPDGLVLNGKNGMISGVPLRKSHETEYTITGKNMTAACSTTISFAVGQAPPESVKYDGMKDAELSFRSNLRFVPEVKYKGGAALKTGFSKKTWMRIYSSNADYVGTRWRVLKDSWWQSFLLRGAKPELQFSVSPDLPTGMTLSSKTGTIAGRPQKQAAKQTYTVSCSNDQGNCTTQIAFAVVLAPPAALQYGEVPNILYEAQGYTFNPEVKGWVTGWRVEPELPEGMVLDDGIGTVTGEPIGSHPETTYMVYAINEAGECSVGLTFCVKRQAPASLRYPDAEVEEDLLYPLNREIPELIPFVMDSQSRPVIIDTYTIEPELPDGLSMDENGIIRGSPTTPTPAAEYTITAANETGSCSRTIAFEIKDMAVRNLHYGHIDPLYAVGEDINLDPEIEGVADSFSVDKPLPPGVTLDEKTGKISGTPTGIVPEDDYTISAVNEHGECSVVITIQTSSPPPTSIAYPEMGRRVVVNKEMPDGMGVPVVEPTPAGCTFKIEPELPEGISMDEHTGIITGKPKAAGAEVVYSVTATNPMGTITGELKFAVTRPQTDAYVIDESFAADLEDCTDLEQLPAEPHQKKQIGDWMLWMVQRAVLNDPTLVVFDFSNLNMPLPHIEPRIAPKLMEAMKTNTNIKSLLMSNSNFRNPQAPQLAEALKVNTTLEVVNVESNFISSESLIELVSIINENEESKLSSLRIANQKNQVAGRRCEQAVSEMMQKNRNITRLGFQAQDAHWNDQISRHLLRNVDVARRNRKKNDGNFDETELYARQVIDVMQIKLVTVPNEAVWELLDDEDELTKISRQFMWEKKRLPLGDQLKAYCAEKLPSARHTNVAPIVKELRKKMFNATQNLAVEMTDPRRRTYKGILTMWSERNEYFHFWATNHDEKTCYDFFVDKIPIIALADNVREWAK